PSVRRFQPRVTEPPDHPIEPPQTLVVRRAVVLVVTPEIRVERCGLILYRVVPMLLAPLRHRLHTPSEAFAHGPDVNREPPPAAARPDMREAEELEGRGVVRVGTARERRASERQQPRLLGMQRQSIRRKSLGKHLQDPLRVLAILKAENEIISVPDCGCRPGSSG